MKKYRKQKPRIFLGKKAQTQDTQFNWIFILIVGALILAFFSYVVIKQKASSEAKYEGKTAQMLDTILVGAKVSSGTVQDIPIPKTSIRFTCNDYYIGAASRRLGNRIIFAPEFVEGTKLITWTLDWNVPFKTSSFLYITTPKIKYVVVGVGQEANKIYDALPDSMYKEIIPDQFETSDEGDENVRFIFVNKDGVRFAIPELDSKVSGVIIDTLNKKIQFLEESGISLVTGASPVFDYITDEEMYGAIFSEKHSDYQCLEERAYQRLSLVSDIYFRKLNTLAPEWQGTSCWALYTNNNHLESIRDAAMNFPPGYDAIRAALTGLQTQNDNAQLWSCPLIY